MSQPDNYTFGELYSQRQRINRIESELHDAKASLDLMFWCGLCGVVTAIVMALAF